MRAVPSSEAVAIWLPSGLNAIETIWFEWAPRKVTSTPVSTRKTQPPLSELAVATRSAVGDHARSVMSPPCVTN